MPKKTKQGFVYVEVEVSVPRAGEFKVALPISVDTFLDPPMRADLQQVMFDEVIERLRVKLVKGEAQRFNRTAFPKPKKPR